MKTYQGSRVPNGQLDLSGNPMTNTKFVVIDDEAVTITPLRHYVRHSPTGMEWGYGGSGPADLARSILIDVLGDEALCNECGGLGLVVLDQETGAEHKTTEAEIRKYRQLQEANDPLGDLLMKCFWCDDGVKRLPYQAFKFDFVAKWDRDQFSVSEDEVRSWYEMVRRQE